MEWSPLKSVENFKSTALKVVANAYERWRTGRIDCISCFFFLLQHCGASEPSSPLLLMERLSFEMHKTYTETRLQLHLSPATIVLVDGNEVRKNTVAVSLVLHLRLCGKVIL